MYMKKLAHFILYNNLVPLTFGVLFLGAGATLAASPEMRETIVSSEEELTSIDNSFLLRTNINKFPFVVTVRAVKEDSEAYYVEYRLTTIDLVQGVWQPITRTNTLQVAKEVVENQDLGLYISKQLAEVRDGERTKLLETQRIEKTLGESKKVVSKKYKGLVGKYLDPKDQVFDNYDPIFTPDPVIVDPVDPNAPVEEPEEEPEEDEDDDFITVVGDREVVIPDINSGGGGSSNDNDDTDTASTTEEVPEPPIDPPTSDELTIPVVVPPVVEETPEPEPVTEPEPEPASEPEVSENSPAPSV
jgi:hypothetical protein